jgi:non-ribosomal peptide synthetase component F
VSGLRFDNHYMQPCLGLDADQTRQWHAAYQGLCRLVLDSANQREVLLKEGQVLIVDNQRMLHGRKRFSMPPPDTPPRHLRLCYFADALNDRKAGAGQIGLGLLHAGVARQAARSPSKVALIVGEGGSSVTYGALWAAAGELAARLRSRLGPAQLRPEARVVICIERSVEAVVAMFAVLRLGCALVCLVFFFLFFSFLLHSVIL